MLARLRQWASGAGGYERLKGKADKDADKQRKEVPLTALAGASSAPRSTVTLIATVSAGGPGSAVGLQGCGGDGALALVQSNLAPCCPVMTLS
jgi:hypothetical protein